MITKGATDLHAAPEGRVCPQCVHTLLQHVNLQTHDTEIVRYFLAVSVREKQQGNAITI